MIKSMTGFGRGEVHKGERKITVEIKAVNHRYFDVNVKMPKSLISFEAPVRTLLKEYIERGKVDVFISLQGQVQDNCTVTYNDKIARQYLECYRRMNEDLGLPDDIKLSTIGRNPEVFTLMQESDDEDELWSELEAAVRMACERFVQVRAGEGEHLKKDLLDKLDRMEKNVVLVDERRPAIVAAYRARIEEKVRELLGDTQIDESRLAAEIVLFSDKICTDEETVRLGSHIRSMKENLAKGGAVGRKLDFIAQEMNREANTILSKANDLETSQIAIDLKTEIEKVREQIQNIE